MTQPMKRETATQTADLPHQFDERADQTCEVCSGYDGDPRHTAWQQRETASARVRQGFPRQTGS